MHFKVGRDPVRNLWKFSTIISDGVREGSLKTLVLMDHKDSTEMQGGGFCDNLC